MTLRTHKSDKSSYSFTKLKIESRFQDSNFCYLRVGELLKESDAAYVYLCERIMKCGIHLRKTGKETSENTFISIHIFMNSSKKFIRCVLNQCFYAVQKFRLMC